MYYAYEGYGHVELIWRGAPDGISDVVVQFVNQRVLERRAALSVCCAMGQAHASPHLEQSESVIDWRPGEVWRSSAT